MFSFSKAFQRRRLWSLSSLFCLSSVSPFRLDCISSCFVNHRHRQHRTTIATIATIVTTIVCDRRKWTRLTTATVRSKIAGNLTNSNHNSSLLRATSKLALMFKCTKRNKIKITHTICKFKSKFNHRYIEFFSSLGQGISTTVLNMFRIESSSSSEFCVQYSSSNKSSNNASTASHWSTLNDGHRWCTDVATSAKVEWRIWRVLVAFARIARSSKTSLEKHVYEENVCIMSS